MGIRAYVTFSMVLEFQIVSEKNVIAFVIVNVVAFVWEDISSRWVFVTSVACVTSHAMAPQELFLVCFVFLQPFYGFLLWKRQRINVAQCLHRAAIWHITIIYISIEIDG